MPVTVFEDTGIWFGKIAGMSGSRGMGFDISVFDIAFAICITLYTFKIATAREFRFIGVFMGGGRGC